MSSKQKLQWSSKFPTEEGWYLFRTGKEYYKWPVGIVNVFFIGNDDEYKVSLTFPGLYLIVSKEQWTKEKYQTIGPIPEYEKN